MTSSSLTTFHWIRHAPVKSMIPGRIYGQRDVACDLKNDVPLKKLAHLFPHDAIWVTSTLMRTKKTAKAIQSHMEERPSLLSYKELNEQNFGLWQSKTWDELGEDETARSFWNDPVTTCPPDGESFADLHHRVQRTITHLCKKYSGRHLICVAHAGTIRSAIAESLNLSLNQAMKFKIDPLSYSQLSLYQDTKGTNEWSISHINLL